MNESSAAAAADTAGEAPRGAAQAHLRARKSKPFFGRHPWVLHSAIERVSGEPSDGDVVELVSDKGRFVARGIINRRSRIRVRLYSWDPAEPLDEGFFRRRLTAAIRLRRDLGYDVPQGACRLVFSEADGLSGLIVDRYGPYLAVQLNALAMAVRWETLCRLLVELISPHGIVLRNERGVPQAEGLEHREGLAWGEPPSGPLFIEEHGLRYGVDLLAGQKTGFYLDQRQNRAAVAAYLAGRKVLDMCSYSGGFSLAAARLGPAREVVGYDSSAKAVELARANAQLNGLANVQFHVGECFETLAALAADGARFGGVVLDPPKFARSRQALGEALRAYHRINRLAVELLEPGGILATCSCSGHVSREDFLLMLSGVAQQTGRQLQVLEQRGAAADHPVSVTCLESEYLKCFVCRVE